jgi:hypothetical protein
MMMMSSGSTFFDCCCLKTDRVPPKDRDRRPCSQVMVLYVCLAFICLTSLMCSFWRLPGTKQYVRSDMFRGLMHTLLYSSQFVFELSPSGWMGVSEPLPY